MVPPQVLSCLLWLIGAICWVVSFLYPNENSVPSYVTNIWRGLMTMVLNYMIARIKNQHIDIADITGHRFSLLKAFLTVISAGVFAAVQFYLPLSVVHTINNLAPIVVILLEFFIYGTKISKQQGLGVLLGFGGIFVIIFNVQQPEQTKFENYVQVGPLEITLACIGSLVSLLTFGFGILTMKKLRKVNATQIGFYTGILTFLTNAILFICKQGSAEASNASVVETSIFYKGFIFSGLIFSFGSLIQLYALQIWSQSGLIVLMELSTVVWAYLISIFRYEEPVNLVCLGGVILAISGLGLVVANSSDGQEQIQDLQGSIKKK